jgi:hypothetical protein
LPGEHDVHSWKRVDPATVPLEQHLALNYSHCTWSVSLRNGAAIAAAYVEKPPLVPSNLRLPADFGQPRVLQQGRSGTLIGYNHGEWGGALFWFAADGTVRDELLDDNIVAILPATDRFVVLAGLSHLGRDRGQVVELIDTGAGFTISRRTEIGSAPRAATMESDGAFLIVTRDGLARLTPAFHVHRLRDTDWGMFYPVSIVIDDAGNAYVGMRGIVVEVALGADPLVETWLYPA